MNLIIRWRLRVIYMPRNITACLESVQRLALAAVTKPQDDFRGDCHSKGTLRLFVWRAFLQTSTGNLNNRSGSLRLTRTDVCALQSVVFVNGGIDSLLRFGAIRAKRAGCCLFAVDVVEHAPPPHLALVHSLALSGVQSDGLLPVAVALYLWSAYRYVSR